MHAADPSPRQVQSTAHAVHIKGLTADEKPGHIGVCKRERIHLRGRDSAACDLGLVSLHEGFDTELPPLQQAAEPVDVAGSIAGTAAHALHQMRGNLGLDSAIKQVQARKCHIARGLGGLDAAQQVAAQFILAHLGSKVYREPVA